jgi:hypothetical protein
MDDIELSITAPLICEETVKDNKSETGCQIKKSSLIGCEVNAKNKNASNGFSNDCITYYLLTQWNI